MILTWSYPLDHVTANGFKEIIPSGIVSVGYAVAFYCLSLVLKTLPIGIAYAIWSGLGVVLIAVVESIYTAKNWIKLRY
ncbi:hypothetical protein JQC92_19595 [Shewanella sp. 202IG2-18]|nr:hypothetical protein [Parashewanella hymeniacidonis]